jgi:hypothetical protein
VKRRILTIVSLVAAALLGLAACAPVAAQAQSTTLYVSTTGNDNNDGSSPLLAFATIEEADAHATPGTLVLVADGTYNVTDFGTTADGSVGSPIVFAAENPLGAVIVGSNTAGPAVWRSYGDHVVIDGFELSGANDDGLIVSGSHTQILNNRAESFTNTCMSVYTSAYDQVNIDFIGNVAAWCGSSNQDHGIYVAHTGGIVANNIAYGNRGYGIHCWHACDRLQIVNNLVFNNDEGGIVVGQGDDPNNGAVPADYMLVANNIAVGNGTHEGIRESGATGPNNLYLNNLVNGNAIGGVDIIGGGAERGTVTSSPGFVNYQSNGSGDYHLAGGSAARNTGHPHVAHPVAVDGTVRPQGSAPDMGVYEQN